MTLEQIERKLNDAEKEFEYWKQVKETHARILEIDVTKVEESKAAYVCYMLYGSVTEAAKAMNELGFRIGTRKYQSNDISNIIDDISIDDTSLQETVRSLLKNGRKFINKQYN